MGNYNATTVGPPPPITMQGIELTDLLARVALEESLEGPTTPSPDRSGLPPRPGSRTVVSPTSATRHTGSPHTHTGVDAYTSLTHWVRSQTPQSGSVTPQQHRSGSTNGLAPTTAPRGPPPPSPFGPVTPPHSNASASRTVAKPLSVIAAPPAIDLFGDGSGAKTRTASSKNAAVPSPSSPCIFSGPALERELESLMNSEGSDESACPRNEPTNTTAQAQRGSPPALNASSLERFINAPPWQKRLQPPVEAPRAYTVLANYNHASSPPLPHAPYPSPNHGFTPPPLGAVCLSSFATQVSPSGMSASGNRSGSPSLPRSSAVAPAMLSPEQEAPTALQDAQASTAMPHARISIEPYRGNVVAAARDNTAGAVSMIFCTRKLP